VLALDVVQAAFGDCLVLRYGSDDRPRALLIDGGPGGTYADHLRPVLLRLGAAGVTIDAVVLSHIDNDHVTGLLDLLDDVDLARQGAGPSLPPIRALWHNAFSLSAGGADIAPRVREALGLVARRGFGPSLAGVAEGDALRSAADRLEIPINTRFPDGRVLLDDAPSLRLAGPTVDVIGPGEQILAKLRRQWLAWLEEHGRDVEKGLMPVGVAPDQSVPNLSSIVLLVRTRGKSVLLTGDGRGDQILDGLGERGLLDDQGRTHVDVLKVPHHGSARNASLDFFRKVTADTYAISADGRYGNPDEECLRWIVDAAVDDGREIELVLTNQTEASQRLVAERPPAQFGYRVRVLPPGEDSITIPIVP
jgi:hypothetical protein